MLLINPVNRIYGGRLHRYVPLLVPMTLGCLASVMLENGFAVRVHDEELQKITPSLLDEIVRGLPQPYVFGISVLTAQAARAYELAGILKEKYPDCTVIVGGYHPTALPEEALSIKAIDVVVRGEGDRSLIALYRALRDGATDLTHLRGISFRQGDTIVHTEDMPLITDLDTLPDFPYHLFSELLQRTGTRTTYDWSFILTSRGCPYRCTYCSQRLLTGATYRFRAPEKVVAEVAFLIEKFKVKEIFFIDDNLLVNQQRVRALCARLDKSGLTRHCTFGLQTRADNLSPEIMPLLKEAGFTSVGLGMEVGSDRLADLIGKEQTVQEYCTVAKRIKDYGMELHLFMMFGLPTETAEERRKAFQLAKGLRPSVLKFSNLIPYPGTPMYESVRSSGRCIVNGYWENFTTALSEIVLFSRRRQPLPYVPETTSEWELIRDLIRYNTFMMLRPSMFKSFITGRKGVGALTMPTGWQRQPKEYFYLISGGIIFGMMVLVVLLPLWITAPIMQRLFPRFQRRVPPQARVPYTPHRWTRRAYQKTCGTP